MLFLSGPATSVAPGREFRTKEVSGS